MKIVKESIKHLTGRSDKEIIAGFEDLYKLDGQPLARTLVEILNSLESRSDNYTFSEFRWSQQDVMEHILENVADYEYTFGDMLAIMKEESSITGIYCSLFNNMDEETKDEALDKFLKHIKERYF